MLCPCLCIHLLRGKITFFFFLIQSDLKKEKGHYEQPPLYVHAKSLWLYLTLWDPTDCSPPGSLSTGFSRQEHWSGLPCPSPTSFWRDNLWRSVQVAKPWEVNAVTLGQFGSGDCLQLICFFPTLRKMQQPNWAETHRTERVLVSWTDIRI